MQELCLRCVEFEMSVSWLTIDSRYAIEFDAAALDYIRAGSINLGVISKRWYLMPLDSE